MEARTKTEAKATHPGERPIAMSVTAVAIGAMAVDHLLGDDPGLEDPPMFVIACVVTLAAAALVFGRIVPRAKAADRSARDGLILSIVAVVPGIATLWLGPPFALAGGGLTLGLHAWQRAHDRRGAAAIVVAALMLGFGTIAYLVQAVDKLG
jgi:hypothetical protein